MAKQPEVRLSQGAVIAIIAIVAVGLFGWNAGWFASDGAAPGGDGDVDEPVVLQVVPAIEKTTLYASTIDEADFEGENQKNRVVGTADLIKSGNVLEIITTSATTGVTSTAELNGGDVVTVLGDAANYYAHAVEDVTITETLQPFETMIKAAATPDTEILDDKKDTLSPMNITLDTNDVSKTHYVNVERPGDDTWYQLCLIGADFDDEQVEVRVKDATGSFVEGNTNLDEDFDELDGVGVDAVWMIDEPIKNFDTIEIPFIIGTANDIDPTAETVGFYVVDCEENLQNGEIVYTVEDAADADVGLAHIVMNITIN